MKEKRAMTVLGPVSADELGTTLTHEHLLFDQIDYVRVVLWTPKQRSTMTQRWRCGTWGQVAAQAGI